MTLHEGWKVKCRPASTLVTPTALSLCSQTAFMMLCALAPAAQKKEADMERFEATLRMVWEAEPPHLEKDQSSHKCQNSPYTAAREVNARTLHGKSTDCVCPENGNSKGQLIV